jgi:hypothetical protein
MGQRVGKDGAAMVNEWDNADAVMQWDNDGATLGQQWGDNGARTIFITIDHQSSVINDVLRLVRRC